MIKAAVGMPGDSGSSAPDKVGVAVRSYLDGVIDAEEMVREVAAIIEENPGEFPSEKEDSSWSHAAPVFAPNYDLEQEYANGDKLPALWITDPVFDVDGNPAGRNCINLYLPDGDLGGEDALYFGGCYYDEGMGYTDPVDRDRGIDCFRAAEVLYRHSAGRGNAVANLCLGYVYSYDRCEGRYWRDPMTLNTAEDYKRPYPREERAFECFRKAAEVGICEACYKLGDMYKHGMGCDPDADEAFRWYVRASELAQRERPVVLGSVALRLGECYEEGIGGPVRFGHALVWYSKAVDCLSAAVDAGATWYARALASARAGVKRCEQESAEIHPY